MVQGVGRSTKYNKSNGGEENVAIPTVTKDAKLRERENERTSERAKDAGKSQVKKEVEVIIGRIGWFRDLL